MIRFGIAQGVLTKSAQRGAFALFALLCLGGRLPAQPTRSNDASCRACVITPRSIVSLGSTDGPGFLSGRPRTVRVDSHGRYWVIVWREAPHIYDATGSFIVDVGRPGRGPGEFGGTFDAIPVGGDSVLVVDNMLARGTLIAPDLKPGRTTIIPAQLLGATVRDWPTDVVANMAFEDAARIGWPLHTLSFAEGNARVVASFGSNRGERRPGGGFQLMNPLSSMRNGYVWSSERLEYKVTQWDKNGNAVRQFEHRPSWFEKPSVDGIGTPSTPPPPNLWAIEVDSLGLLWVFARVPARDWRAAWPPDTSKAYFGTNEVASRAIHWEKLFDTMVEVLDPVEGNVIVRSRIPGYLIAALPGRRVAMYSVAADGTPRVRIEALVLTGR